MAEITIPCVCPVPGAHTEDTIYLPDTLGFTALAQLVMSARWYSADTDDMAKLLAHLQEAYLLYTLSGWTLVDAEGKPLPLTEANVRTYLMANPSVAFDVADAADDLYGAAVVRPLVNRAKPSSLRGQTAGSTSARRRRGPRNPKPRLRSLTTTTPTAATG
jgi:hypothetical protein